MTRALLTSAFATVLVVGLASCSGSTRTTTDTFPTAMSSPATPSLTPASLTPASTAAAPTTSTSSAPARPVATSRTLASPTPQPTSTKPSSSPSPSRSASPSSSPTPSPRATSTSPAATTRQLTIKDFLFTPRSLTVPVGTTVTVTNQDGATHDWTSDASLWASGDLSRNASFSYRFDVAGTFSYMCRRHGGDMNGTVTVTP